jgi:hypothetical protein
MAVTGKSTIPVEPGPRKTGALVVSVLEASSQTFPRGAILSKSAGSIVFHGTSNLSVNLYGIALASGKNGSADGAKTNAIYRFERDGLYKVVISGTVAQSQMGNTLALSQDTAGKVFGITAAASSDSSVARMVKFAEGFTAADTNPVIYFTPLGAKIQEG